MSAETIDSMQEVLELQKRLRIYIEEGESLQAFHERVLKLQTPLQDKLKEWKVQLEKLEKLTDQYRNKAIGATELFWPLSQFQDTSFATMEEDSGLNGNVAVHPLCETKVQISTSDANCRPGESTIQLRNPTTPDESYNKDEDINCRLATYEMNSKRLLEARSAKSSNVDISNLPVSASNNFEDLKPCNPEMVKMVSDGESSAGTYELNYYDDEGYSATDFTDGANDRSGLDWAALLSIFPEEVWILLLDGISDPGTLESLSNASPVFRTWLLSRRVEFLFPMVWNVIGVKYRQRANEYPCDGDGTFRDPPAKNSSANLDRISYYQEDDPVTKWYSTIMKLRLVCSVWCQALDNWFQTYEFQKEMNNDYTVIRLSNIIKHMCMQGLEEIWFAEDTKGRMELFRTHFKSSHIVDGIAKRSPFFGRSVRVICEWKQNRGQSLAFWKRVKKLFVVYGNHVWYLTIGISENPLTMRECYSIIRTLLTNVPNLKKRHIEYLQRSFSYKYPNSKEQEVTQLNSDILTHPFPKLASLQYLTTRPFQYSTSDIRSQIFHELLRASEHAARLDLGECWIPDYRLLSKNTTPHLQQLTLKISAGWQCENFTASEVEWQLSKLDLDLTKMCCLDWDQLFFKLRKKWGHTLTRLYLKLPIFQLDKVRFTQSADVLNMDFHRLLQVRLDMANLHCLDFLTLTSNTLEVLEISVCGKVETEDLTGLLKGLEDDGQIILLSVPENPINSNVWKVFHKLQRLNFRMKLQCLKPEKYSDPQSDSDMECSSSDSERHRDPESDRDSPRDQESDRDSPRAPWYNDYSDSDSSVDIENYYSSDAESFTISGSSSDLEILETVDFRHTTVKVGGELRVIGYTTGEI